MSDLYNKKCIPCKGDIPGFDITEIHKYLKMVDGWEVKSDESEIYYLIKGFKFKNFLESQNFVNKVGEYCGNRRSSSRYLVWLGLC